MESHMSDQSVSAPNEISTQSKEADAIFPAIAPKDGVLDESHCKPVFAQVDIGVLYEEEEEGMSHGYLKDI